MDAQIQAYFSELGDGGVSRVKNRSERARYRMRPEARCLFSFRLLTGTTVSV